MSFPRTKGFGKSALGQEINHFFTMFAIIRIIENVHIGPGLYFENTKKIQGTYGS
jgi:hypothetical protein